MRTLVRLLLSGFAIALSACATGPQGGERWVASWATSLQVPEPQNSLPEADLADATLRQLVRLSIGGDTVRVAISNVFGAEPLTIGGAHIARPLKPDGHAIDPSTDRELTFNGRRDVTIPPGATFWSDAVAFEAKPLSFAAISIYLPKAPTRQTGHPGSRATSYYVHGDHVSAPMLDAPKTVTRWYQIASLAVTAPAGARAIVTLGDSITDGNGSTTNAANRWPDVLADRLQASPAHRDIAVLNAGIGGNRLLGDGLGPSAASRVERDIIAPPGASYLLVLEGVNDIGGLARTPDATPDQRKALVEQMIETYRQIVLKARAAGIKAYGMTIMPFGASNYYPARPEIEAMRQAVNAWIRTPGNFDAVIDLEPVFSDGAAPPALKKSLDNGDGLHPSVAGHRAIAEAVPLSLFD